MARAWFFRVLLNSSSFSAILRSISCLTCPSSRAALSTLFSSASREPSASSRACCSSSFSVSRRLLCLSSSWMERPPSPSWSRRSLISSARFLFSRRTISSCSLASSRPDLRRNLGIEVAALRLAGIKLSVEVVGLGLPLTNNLVKVAATLLGDAGGGVGALVLHGNLLQLTLHPHLGLLSGADLVVEVLNVLLSFSDLGSKLGLAALKLINAAKSLGLVLGLPQLNLCLGLGQSLEAIVLLLRFLINLHPQVLSLSVEVLVLGE